MEGITDRENKWLSIQEAAEELGVNPRTVRRYIRLGRLDVSRISNKVVRIRLADLDRLMEANIPERKAPEGEAPEGEVRQKAHVRTTPQRPSKPAQFNPGKFG